ncbi:acetyltransferase (GNAT) family protein [Micromonospora pisi]|uniref:Acetyltransferase (GNAT) family protein n=1 Tax=Micromonospora pisi TaxID=589240 RepID=A0A495JK97_9ACTN|nr:GNAT family N-acetyltransferase [Micromonospora pisi]RKR88419.1 acetyltransferase (GNAT) family protein [Micromonospora pisi]
MTPISGTAEAARLATIQDIERLARSMGNAFAGAPDAEYLIADPRIRQPIYKRVASETLHHAVVHGMVICTPDHTAVAVWYPATALPLPDAEAAASIEHLCPGFADRWRSLGAALDERRPTGTDWWYLACLGVDPAWQSSGIGSALLRERNGVLDAEGSGAYLVATSARSRSLYLRHGYEDMGTPVTLPDGPTMWPMWRQPQPSGRMV